LSGSFVGVLTHLFADAALASFPRPGGPKFMDALFYIIEELLNLYKWAVILSAVFSMLVSFNILDSRNRVVWSIGDFLYRVTEPALRPIRRFLPNFGAIDISPVILIVLIQALQILTQRIQFGLMSNGVYF
jgi:YggT family protein